MADLRSLVPRILEKARERKLRWEELGRDTYVAPVGKMSVQIGGGEFGVYTIAVRNDDGIVVESLTPGATYPDPVGEQMLLELYDIARRSVYNTDETLENLKKQLDSL